MECILKYVWSVLNIVMHVARALQSQSQSELYHQSDHAISANNYTEDQIVFPHTPNVQVIFNTQHKYNIT